MPTEPEPQASHMSLDETGADAARVSDVIRRVKHAQLMIRESKCIRVHALVCHVAVSKYGSVQLFCCAPFLFCDAVLGLSCDAMSAVATSDRLEPSVPRMFLFLKSYCRGVMERWTS